MPMEPVHPRVCGEAVSLRMIFVLASGPSPRVRGSRPTASTCALMAGSIPACAGKPGATPSQSRRSGVHPRVCGEAPAADVDAWSNDGPSPRVRGSREVTNIQHLRRGSIPACAGKPRSHRHQGYRVRVHPRVCGEARVGRVVQQPLDGPSPRVRGSRSCQPRDRVSPRSIPACAGKPRTSRTRNHRCRVHPRVCGEAVDQLLKLELDRGPSPRVRGSQDGSSKPSYSEGSIPACAGKPTRGGRSRSGPGVHPRVCGEARKISAEEARGEGPSPRVRGSRLDHQHLLRFLGSIPACAGKPGSRAPRRCG